MPNTLSDFFPFTGLTASTMVRVSVMCQLGQAIQPKTNLRYPVTMINMYNQLTLNKGDYPKQSRWAYSNLLKSFLRAKPS